MLAIALSVFFLRYNNKRNKNLLIFWVSSAYTVDKFDYSHDARYFRSILVFIDLCFDIIHVYLLIFVVLK